MKKNKFKNPAGNSFKPASFMRPKFGGNNVSQTKFSTVRFKTQHKG